MSPDARPNGLHPDGGSSGPRAQDPALLIAAHGTRSPAGVAECAALVDRVRARAPELAVAHGFIELSPPPIAASIDELVAAGRRSIVVVPLVLFDAGHSKTDVPAVVNAARARHRGVTFTYGQGLGIDHDLVAATHERLADVVPEPERSETAVLLVGRGATDPASNAEAQRLGRLLWEGRSWSEVEVAYVSLTAPRVPEGLDRLHRLGHTRVAVVPYFLFAGVLVDRIGEQARAFAASRPATEVRVAGHLGSCDAVADRVLQRYREARDGQVRRDCDTCVYRVEVPGFESKAGAPLVPHHHPDDPSTHGHGPHATRDLHTHATPEARGVDGTAGSHSPSGPHPVEQAAGVDRTGGPNGASRPHLSDGASGERMRSRPDPRAPRE
ncbi:sirohydrochlorin chelatase [Egibacter rhizosphaerae]|uniref:Sirohydrochlorin chelatase n=1 Tax=Egibacter rhizosphaerae TaxID=1670831 RepID=A0A411YF15_9ACTN|nr:sirohydrochlorin chelatase [Egibacter rhizosphaerae]QBI19815.1 sirohydrochlorin chelatase [Egibacter rhizosphaerae]